VITGLGAGGAEMALARLAPRFDRNRWETIVVALGPEGIAADALRRDGIETIALGVGTTRSAAGAAAALVRFARARRPDLVHGWMYHGNLAAALAATGRLVWGVRQGLYDFVESPLSTRFAIRMGAALSFLPDRIVYNADEARRQHEAIGYRETGALVIPNGYDLSAFAGSAGARERIRAALGFPPEVEVVGFVARRHPVKNHDGFFEAASRLAARRPSVRFVLAGPGTDDPSLLGLAERAGIATRVRLLGERGDVPDLLHAFELATLASHGEAFPNALAEAMAAGVPCVATDVGEVRSLLGGTGWLVPPRDAGALAEGWERLLAVGPEGRRSIGAAARERIRARFGIDRAVAAYEGVYGEVLGV
jgi:glycosyltransferase involved in cell wall biosynthesis